MRTRSIQVGILAIMLDCKLHTIKEIASKLEVSYSTVQRYIKELAIDFPIQVSLGGRNSGGVRLKSVINNNFVDKNELDTIIKSLTFFKNYGIDVQQDKIQKLIEKLSI